MSRRGRVFSDAKLVDGRALNLAGVQVFRALLARLLYGLRAAPDDPLARELTRMGMVTLEGFLPADLFAAIVAEAAVYASARLPRWMHQYGTTTVRTFPLLPADLAAYPVLAAWRSEPRALALASAGDRRTRHARAGAPLFEHITFGDGTEGDAQTALHADTFFNTHKVWLYLDDVAAENGALVYVPGSHHLDRVRLREEYRATSRRRECTEPSRRVSDAEVNERGLARKVVTCPRNTLVVANTCGYHARSVAEPGQSRRALHMAFRSNPFTYPMPRAARLVHAAQRVGAEHHG